MKEIQLWSKQPNVLWQERIQNNYSIVQKIYRVIHKLKFSEWAKISKYMHGSQRIIQTYKIEGIS